MSADDGNWADLADPMPPDARTALEHAEKTLRTFVRDVYEGADSPRVAGAIAAINALVAQVERLERERDELETRYIDFAPYARRCQERDEAVARAEAAEARAVQAEREAERWHREALDWQQAKSEADDDWEEAEARAQRYREALTALLNWASGKSGDDFGETEWNNARRALSADPLVCRDPNLCWGTGTCPRDPACDE